MYFFSPFLSAHLEISQMVLMYREQHSAFCKQWTCWKPWTNELNFSVTSDSPGQSAFGWIFFEEQSTTRALKLKWNLWSHTSRSALKIIQWLLLMLFAYCWHVSQPGPAGSGLFSTFLACLCPASGLQGLTANATSCLELKRPVILSLGVLPSWRIQTSHHLLKKWRKRCPPSSFLTKILPRVCGEAACQLEILKNTLDFVFLGDDWVEVPLLAAWRTLLHQHPATLLPPALQQMRTSKPPCTLMGKILGLLPLPSWQHLLPVWHTVLVTSCISSHCDWSFSPAAAWFLEESQKCCSMLWIAVTLEYCGTETGNQCQWAGEGRSLCATGVRS